MKTNKRLLTYLFISLIIGIEGCDKNDEDLKTEKKISFDKTEVLYNILPPGTYTAIRFISQNIAYTITNNGGIFKTENGGETWIQQDSGTELYLYDMFFSDDLNGYIVGGQSDGIILRTTNGGKTWLSSHFQESLSSIYFINKTTGFAAGKKLFRTKDDGKTWDEIDLGYFAYSSINFFDENNGLLTAVTPKPFQSVLLKTTDKGNHWFILDNIVKSGEIQVLNNLVFLHSYSNIFKTSDRGNTWETIIYPASGPVHFLNEWQAIGVGQHWYELGYFPNGMLCITNDGGKHWEEKLFSAEEFLSINDIDFPNDSTALAIGNSPQGCIIKLHF
ncbi:YCF48-related protein [Parabacteroides sp. Marseille-P3160]|uniref:YCF48-related protein n=1 Tax=Parabacteroides sp. Marseille-P3160 TaxID=1917887 RepID=UPI0009BADC6E|nr:YCF48-related protein [Parabacteroides sp. Marseille-P3160]